MSLTSALHLLGIMKSDHTFFCKKKYFSKYAGYQDSTTEIQIRGRRLTFTVYGGIVSVELSKMPLMTSPIHFILINTVQKSKISNWMCIKSVCYLGPNRIFLRFMASTTLSISVSLSLSLYNLSFSFFVPDGSFCAVQYQPPPLPSCRL